MTNTPPRRIVVFWLAHFTGNPNQKGWDTKLVHPRYKDFNDETKARKLVATLIARRDKNEPYCSRYVSQLKSTSPSTDSDMRLYSFVNYYLSGLQHGLQTAHAAVDMGFAYKRNTKQHKAYEDWAVNHKTIIICNGGNDEMLGTLYEQLKLAGDQFGLPVVKFHEDKQSLNGALTVVSMVLPVQFYDVEFARWRDAGGGPNMYTCDKVPECAQFIEGRDPEYDLIALIKSHRLA